ncbi:MAG: helix-turn-helix domain-containing protein [Treponema sp.]|nr:helix-turn-helix domain-containing protein [Treponema sp.]
MTRLRTILAGNLKAYRNEMGLSQLKLASLVDTAPNYIAMIEAEKRFPSDTMLEKIAAALRREPCELFAITPIQKQWQETLLAELAEFISSKL